jgi:hypothetical protein
VGQFGNLKGLACKIENFKFKSLILKNQLKKPKLGKSPYATDLPDRLSDFPIYPTISKIMFDEKLSGVFSTLPTRAGR